MEPVLNARFAVLHLLRQGEAHGQELIRRAERVTGGRIRLSPARVYPALGALARAGLIKGRRLTPGGARGARARTLYALTEAGRRAASEQRHVLAALVEGIPVPPDARERAQMAERLLRGEELSRAGAELREAMARALRP